jgi:chemotaxis protein MotB
MSPASVARFAVPLVFSMVAACGVPKDEHAKLKTSFDQAAADRDGKAADLEKTKLALGAAQTRGDDLAKQLEAANAKATAMESEAGGCRENLAACGRERDKLREDLAAALRDQAGLRGSVEQMKKAMAALERQQKEAEARVAEFKSLLQRFKTLIDNGTLRVKMVDGRMVVSLGSDILFASGSAGLSPEGKKTVADVAKILATVDRKYQVEGHTDNVPIKTSQFPSNWELAAARAITVVDTMMEAGVRPERVSAASFADSRPVQKNESFDGRKANRRIEIVILPDLSSLPGFDELQKVETK